MFVAGLQRNLRQEARARVRRQVAQVRRDAGVLQAPRAVAGGVVYAARVARTGAMTYVGPHGPYTETRDADELRRIVDQLPGTSITLDHPDGMLTSSTPIVGRVLTATYEDGDPAYAVCDLQIDDAGARDAIKSGIRQVSLGYTVALDGDRQTRTKIDHVALVRHARCGDACSVRADCGGDSSCRCSTCLDAHPLFRPRPKENTMSRTPPIDPLTDIAAAERRASTRAWDLGTTFHRGDADPDPTDVAHRSATGANGAPWKWTDLDRDTPASEIKMRLASFGACEFAGTSRSDAYAQLIRRARELGLDQLVEIYERQHDEMTSDDDLISMDAAERRARLRG